MGFDSIKDLLRKAGPGKRDPAASSGGSPAGERAAPSSEQQLVLCQDLLSRLRGVDPSSPDAFPMLNESTRLVQHLEGSLKRVNSVDRDIWRL